MIEDYVGPTSHAREGSVVATNYLLVLDESGRFCDHFELAADTRQFPGWNDSVSGWSIGSLQSGAVIRIDNPRLDHAELGVIPASNHVFLYGRLDEDTEIDIERAAGHESARIEVRFDQKPLRIDRHVIQYFYTLESLNERIDSSQG